MRTHVHITTHAYEKQTAGCKICTLAFSYNVHRGQTAFVSSGLFDMATI